MYNKYFYTYFNCLLLLKNFLILTFNIGYMQLGILWTLSLSPCYLRLGIKTSYFQ